MKVDCVQCESFDVKYTISYISHIFASLPEMFVGIEAVKSSVVFMEAELSSYAP